MINLTRLRFVSYVLLLATSCYLIVSCNSQKREMQETVEKMRQKAIEIPYERMDCWTNDSIIDVSPWKEAKMKLVHYIDSATCSTCYLQKAATNEFLHSMENMADNEFRNVFIINPDKKTRKRLEADFKDKQIPSTIFVDSANVFLEVNPNIPTESMYHTFLLDEGNKVILVGNPMLNKQIEDMMIAVVGKKLGKKLYNKN